jgi:Nif-specific regulatory protein
VERTAAISRGKTIRDINLPCRKNMCFSLALRPISRMSSPVPAVHAETAAAAEPGHDSQAGRGVPEFKSTRERLIWAMEECGGGQAKAARLLGMTTRQMHYALRKYNIEIKKL